MPTYSLASFAPANLNIELAELTRAEVLVALRRWGQSAAVMRQDAAWVARDLRVSLAQGALANASSQWGALLALRDAAREMR